MFLLWGSAIMETKKLDVKKNNKVKPFVQLPLWASGKVTKPYV